MSKKKIKELCETTRKLYVPHNNELPFHGWHHIVFVAKKAVEFSIILGANSFLVESAALLHDLNYIVKRNSKPEIASDLRSEILLGVGYSDKEIQMIENIILEAHLANRIINDNQITDESKALSDADMLFKSLPITPIIFAHKYLLENKIDIYQLTDNVIKEQKDLVDNGVYFYTEIAKRKYLIWAKTNLALWSNVEESLSDQDVQDLLINYFRLA